MKEQLEIIDTGMATQTETQKRILIIEDHADVADIQKLLCEMEGYDVRVAKNGDEGWREIVEFSPHLVMLDLMLPGSMSGNDILKRIHEELEGGGPPILVISALINDATTPRLKSSPNVETMKKPFRVTELARKIHEILDRAPAQTRQ
jgi:two-component system, OmpR family, phosphate regulon response regulator PhoB